MTEVHDASVRQCDAVRRSATYVLPLLILNASLLADFAGEVLSVKDTVPISLSSKNSSLSDPRGCWQCAARGLLMTVVAVTAMKPMAINALTLELQTTVRQPTHPAYRGSLERG